MIGQAWRSDEIAKETEMMFVVVNIAILVKLCYFQRFY